jgi:hypothetical protein
MAWISEGKGRRHRTILAFLAAAVCSAVVDKDERAIRKLVRRSRPTLAAGLRDLPAMYNHLEP